jgi:hypothetical protein
MELVGHRVHQAHRVLRELMELMGHRVHQAHRVLRELMEHRGSQVLLDPPAVKVIVVRRVPLVQLGHKVRWGLPVLPVLSGHRVNLPRLA